MRAQLDLVAAFALIDEALERETAEDLRAARPLVEVPDHRAPAEVVPAHRARHDPSRLVTAAAVGSGLMALATWQTAAIPWPRPRLAWLLPEFGVYYAGLATVSVAWLLMGRGLLDTRTPTQVRAVRRFVLAGAGPLLFAAPLGRDLWAYAAQGHLISAGFSPYLYGPGAAPGAFALQVSRHWLFSPSPYGPLWLRMSQAAAWVAHGSPVVAVLLLRIPAFLGLALCAWAVPVLAERARSARSRPAGGRHAAVALWLGVASPLMLVLGVGGGHNDVLMLGLALAGTAVATRPGLPPLALGAGIATLGALIKSPALIAVAFTVPASLIADVRPTARRVVRSCLAATAGCATTLFGVTAASGLGFGWTHRMSSYAGWVNVLSLPSGLTMLGKALTGDGAPRALDETLRTARTAGEIVTVAVLAALWVLAVRRPARTVGCLAAAFGASAMLAPAVQPWYYLWGLVIAGLAVRRRVGVLVLAVAGLVFPMMLPPAGPDLDNGWYGMPVLAAAIASVLLFLRRRQQPDGADPAVRAGDRLASTVGGA